MAELLYKQLSFDIVGAAMEVHNVLGSGFLEAVYQAAFEKELKLRGILFERKVKLPVSYKGDLIGEYEADLLVDGKVVVEIKSVSRFNAAHEAQAIHYLIATGMQLALLVNFGAGSLEYRRIVKSQKQHQKFAPIREIRGINSLDEK
ncbi:MAG: GxxExxY protein [Chloroflexi bacterium]|nr:GxxExxY protein [Chloroflexota bacterium]